MSIDKVIEILSNVKPDNFDMNNPAKCISGQIGRHLHPNDERYHPTVETFAAFTGVSLEKAKEATYPKGEFNPAWEATPQQAIEMLEILRDTGEVDWEFAME